MQSRSPGMLDAVRLFTDFRQNFTGTVSHHDELGTVARVSRHDEALAVTLHVIVAVDKLLCCIAREERVGANDTRHGAAKVERRDPERAVDSVEELPAGKERTDTSSRLPAVVVYASHLPFGETVGVNIAGPSRTGIGWVAAPPVLLSGTAYARTRDASGCVNASSTSR